MDNSQDEWRSRMDQLSSSLSTVEEAAEKIGRALNDGEGTVKRLESRGIDDCTANGLRLGLTFFDTALWLGSVRAHNERFRAAIAKVDEDVASGELPSTAHTWRHQFWERVNVLEERARNLEAQLAALRSALDSLCSD